MKGPFMIVGLAAIILGIIAFAYQGITYTTREKYWKWGQSPRPRIPSEPFRSPPFWAVSLAGGVALLLVSASR